jgi:hypothetical protein
MQKVPVIGSAKHEAQVEDYQIFETEIAGCKVSLRFSSDSNPQAAQRIKDTLITTFFESKYQEIHSFDNSSGDP